MPSDRTDFLREYYQQLSDDIRRSEAIVPKVCAIETGVTLIFLLTKWNEKPIDFPALVVLLTAGWAMHMLINANLWARRSQLMAANVEQEFFTVQDLDALLPRSYYADARVYRYRRIFRVSLFLSAAFFVIALASLLRTADWKTAYVLIVAAVLILSVFIEHRKCGREYSHLVAHAPGRLLDTNK